MILSCDMLKFVRVILSSGAYFLNFLDEVSLSLVLKTLGEGLLLGWIKDSEWPLGDLLEILALKFNWDLLFDLSVLCELVKVINGFVIDLGVLYCLCTSSIKVDSFVLLPINFFPLLLQWVLKFFKFDVDP